MASKRLYRRLKPTEVNDALDNICNFAGSLAVRSSYFLHAGGIHPYPARNCARSTSHPAYTGTESSLSLHPFQHLHKNQYTR